MLEELRIFYRAVYALSEPTPSTRDAIAAVGEWLSSELMAEALSQHGLRAETIDARTVILTDDAFGAASPLMEEIAPGRSPGGAKGESRHAARCAQECVWRPWRERQRMPCAASPGWRDPRPSRSQNLSTTHPAAASRA